MLLDNLSIHAWIQNNQIRTENGDILDFNTHRYLFDIYRDESENLCCIKAGQIGFSTLAILKTIWLAGGRKQRIGYILPTEAMVEKFVGSKVNPIIQENPVILQMAKDKDTVKQKQMGKGFIHYVGAQTPTSAIMLTMDRLVIDEYDKAPQNILELFNSRLQHAKNAKKWVFSNPTLPNFGVDRFWEISDKKMWHVKHLANGMGCKKIYVLDETCIDYQAEIFRCPSCKLEITNEDRRKGEWIATTHGEWSGYWIPLWLNPMISAKQIVKAKATSTKEYFANFVAGLPYINTSNTMTEAMLDANLTNRINSQEGRVIIGIDTGQNIHYTLENKEGMFFDGYCPSVEENEQGDRIPNYNPWDTIEGLLKRFPRSIAIIDQGGDLIGPRILQAKYKGRVFLCWFTKEKRSQQIITWAENDELGKVEADRNRLIQMVVDETKDQRSPLCGKREDFKEFYEHALNIYRVREDKGEEGDPQYNWRWVWKRKGPDHRFLAHCYARIGLDRFANDLAMIIHAGSIIGKIPRAFDGSISTVDTSYLGERADM